MKQIPPKRFCILRPLQPFPQRPLPLSIHLRKPPSSSRHIHTKPGNKPRSSSPVNRQVFPSLTIILLTLRLQCVRTYCSHSGKWVFRLCRACAGEDFRGGWWRVRFSTFQRPISDYKSLRSSRSKNNNPDYASTLSIFPILRNKISTVTIGPVTVNFWNGDVNIGVLRGSQMF